MPNPSSHGHRLFNPSRYNGKVGKVITTLKGKSELDVCNVEDVHAGTITVTKSQNGVFILPVGYYQLLHYYTTAPGKREGTITGIGGDFPSGTGLIVEEGKSFKLRAGAPLTAFVAASQRSRDRFSLKLKLTGAAGEHCVSLGSKLPEFQVLSPSGKLLQEGKFSYG